MAVHEVLKEVKYIDDRLRILEMNNHLAVGIEDSVFAALAHVNGRIGLGPAYNLEGKRANFSADTYHKLLNYAKELRDPAGEATDKLTQIYNAILEPLITRPTYREQDGVLYPGMKIPNKQVLSSTPSENSVGVCDISGSLDPDYFGDWSSKDGNKAHLQVVLPKGLVLGEGYCYNDDTLYERCSKYLGTEPGLINDGYKLKDIKSQILARWQRFRETLDEKDVAKFLIKCNER